MRCLLVLGQGFMSSEKPLVSVLITNYNYGRYIREAIDSALNQSCSDLEVIVVDDGSTDQSREIIASYKDRIIPIFKKNGGQASAINAGFSVSRGDIICSLDADDIWLPQKVERVVEAMRQHPKAVIAYHKVQNIDRAGVLSGKPWPPYKAIQGNIAQTVAQTGGWWPFPPSTALSFRRSFLSKVMDIPEEEYRWSAEPYLADLAPFFGDIVGINQSLSLFRIHGNNYWSNPIDLEARALKNHEIRVEFLNRALQRSGIPSNVSLTDHYPYQLLKYKLGYENNVIKLSSLAFKNPWLSTRFSKVKFVLRLWLSLVFSKTS